MDTNSTISAMEWMDMDFDMETIQNSPWQNMTQLEVQLVQSKYNDLKTHTTIAVADLLIRSPLCLGGLIGHVLILIVLRDREFQNGTFALLRNISISDIMYCASMWLMGCLEYHSINTTSMELMFIYTHVLKNIRGTMGYFSGLLDMALACDRLAAVWFFYTYSKIDAKKKRKAIKGLSVVLFLISMIIQMGWSLSIGVGSTKNSRGKIRYIWEPRDFYLNGAGEMWGMVTTVWYEAFETCFALSSSLITIVGMKRLSKLQMSTQADKDQRKKEFGTCYLSIFICAILLLLVVEDALKKYVFLGNTFATVALEYTNTYAQALDIISAMALQTIISDTLYYWILSLVHASNFYLYLALHRRFRRVFKSKMCKNNQVGSTGQQLIQVKSSGSNPVRVHVQTNTNL